MKLTFTVHVGMLVRQQFRREIEEFCFMNNLACRVTDFGGLVKRSYGFEITGDDCRAFDTLIAGLRSLGMPLEREETT